MVKITNSSSNINQRSNKFHSNSDELNKLKYESSDDQKSQNSQVKQEDIQFDEQQEQSSQQQEKRINFLKQQQQKLKSKLKQIPYGLILNQKSQIDNKKNAILKQKHKKITKKNNLQKRGNREDNENESNLKQIPIHKKPHKRIPVIFEPHRPKTIDPRFQDYAGSYNSDLAMKSYDFIPKIQQQQINSLKMTLQRQKKTSHSSRKYKKLSYEQKQKLTQQYNKLTNQKRQQELQQIERQAKHNIKERTYNNYSNSNNPSNYRPISRQQLKKQFQKVKINRMPQAQKEQYLKNKQKKVQRNKDISKNNTVFQAFQNSKKFY